MGWVGRWLRSLLGVKKETKDHTDTGFLVGVGGEPRRETKRWIFCMSGIEPEVPMIRPPSNPDWLRSSSSSLYTATEKEQSKHAIAVATATAAAAAQAAVTVVRLTSRQSRSTVLVFLERRAAVKIQTVFRGYLAKKALRALRALVKLQALVRGYLVRKQTAATFHSMQALIRAQATVRAQRSHRLLANPEFKPRRSLERFEHYISSASSSLDRSPKIVEMDSCRPKSRSSRRTSSLNFDPSEELSSLSMSSPLPCNYPPAPITIPGVRNRNFTQEYNWWLSGDRLRISSTAQSTPRFSEGGGGTFQKEAGGAGESPGYMGSTESFVAKVRRSQSAPKQRPPEAAKRRVPLSEVGARASLSVVGTERYNNCCKGLDFRGATVGRINRNLELGREAEREIYFQGNW